MQLKRKPLQRLFSALALTSIFGANAYSAENNFFSNHNSIRVFNQKDNNRFTKFFKNNELVENQNFLLSSSIVNPNLLEIDGPAVSLVFKQTKAKAIFEYLAEVGNYGFVWVKNSPNKDNDVDNQRLISMTLNDVSFKKAFN